jgi:hypothetical protein
VHVSGDWLTVVGALFRRFPRRGTGDKSKSNEYPFDGYYKIASAKITENENEDCRREKI